jgi:bacterioferritin
MKMKNEELIAMLNSDLADEHAAIIRYLIHAYQEGEDTPMGAGLLARSREEMWHMHWLGMIICRLGGEPDLKPGPYPFDPKSRATMLKSYVAYEEKLIPHYNAEAKKVLNPHIKRVLQREAWESAIHARRFQRMLDKLSPKDAKGAPGGARALPAAFMEKLQKELAAKYTEMWQHIRMSWVFQKKDIKGWGLMDQAMEKMKQLALFAEAIAEDGAMPNLRLSKIEKSLAIGLALKKALEDVDKSHKRHRKLQADKEFKKHAGLVIKMDLAVQQESYQAEEIKDWIKRLK